MAETRHFLTTVREYVTHWAVGGTVLVLTGFAPEEWTARFAHQLGLPENWHEWLPSGFDPRIALVATGMAVILADFLLRRHKLAPATHEPPVATQPIKSPSLSIPTASDQSIATTLTLPDKPSIAVLPFQNLSGNTEQEYFCDGVVEDITAALSRMKWLFVISRNSSFTYKGKGVDVKQVGHELGVRYVLEGSLRKAANRVRIAGQLIDTTSAAHVWADRFDGNLTDVFDLQDKLTSSVVGAIQPAITVAEIHRAQSKRTESLDAYDYYLRALALSYLATPSAFLESIALCQKAIDLDPNYAVAYGLMAFDYGQRDVNGWADDAVKERNRGAAAARKAIELGRDDPIALALSAGSIVFLARDFDRGVAAVERSLSIDPNSATAWNSRGYHHFWAGEGNGAVECFQRALRLSPRDPKIWQTKGGLGWAHFVEGRYEEAVKWSDVALADQPVYLTSLRCKVAALSQLGHTEDAKLALADLLRHQPNATVTNLRKAMPMRRAADLARYVEGLRKAGLSE